MRDLPMPGSPDISTTQPSPPFACCQRRISSSISSSRPTKGRGGGAQRLEAAVDSARAQHAPDLHRIAKPLDGHRSEIAVIEQPTKKAAGAALDDDGIRLGERLKPRRQIGGLAHHFVVLRRVPADEIADDHQASGDADPQVQRWRLAYIELRHGFDQRQPRAHRPLGIVLMGLRIAEIGEHAVAHIFGDETTGLGDDLGATSVIGADDLLQVFWVEPSREGCRAHKIGEHHRELAALRAIVPSGLGSRGCRRCGRRCVGKLANGAQ